MRKNKIRKLNKSKVLFKRTKVNIKQSFRFVKQNTHFAQKLFETDNYELAEL